MRKATTLEAMIPALAVGNQYDLFIFEALQCTHDDMMHCASENIGLLPVQQQPARCST